MSFWIRSAGKALGLALIMVGATAQGGDSIVKLSTGLEYTSGGYGGTDDIEDLYVPVSALINIDNIALSVTVPYLSVRAPSGTTVIGPGGQPLPGSGAMTTESGLGDVIASVTIYDVFVSADSDLALDLVGKVKFGTADPDKGLGTGEEDFLVRADVYKFFDRFTLMGSGGYKLRGDPSGVDLQNGFLASVGGMYALGYNATVGAFYDYRESSLLDGDAVSEASIFSSHRLGDRWHVQFYAIAGFSDSSPDWGGGVLLTLN